MDAATVTLEEKNGHVEPAKKTEPVELNGGEILVQSLLDQGVELIFGYPGGVVLGLYDTIFKRPELRHVLVRHEQAGTHAADGYARATGKVGVMLATSGPGATNTVTGIATAFMDSIPLVVFTGQVPSGLIGNDAFQEADIIGITRPITKHSYLVKDANELGRVVKEAFHIARTGRPGPVVVDLPKDMLFSKGQYRGGSDVAIPGYKPKNVGHFNQISKAADLISKGKRPLLYIGGGVINANASAELTELALKTGVPVTTTIMGLGAFPETHEQSLGMLGMHGTWYANMAISECDVLVCIGARFDDRVTGRLDGFSQHSKKVHIDVDPACIGKNVAVDIPIVGNAKSIIPGITEHVQKPDLTEWWKMINKWREEHPLRYGNRDDVIMPQFLIEKVSEVTKGEAIVSVDVGQHQMWTAQYYKFTRPRSMLSSSGLGTMGYGFPAAMGAAMAYPDRTVVSITGDGGFQMTAMELATAVEQKVPVKICIVNNGYLGMVRQWQKLFYGGRYSHSHLEPGNPDFVRMAESYGAVGMRATKPEEVVPTLEEAMKITDRPVVMDFWVEKEENVYPMVPAGASLIEMVEGDE